MKPTFLTDQSGPENDRFIVMSAGTLREMWASRLRVGVYKTFRERGENTGALSPREIAFIEEGLRNEAEQKFPVNANYLVRVLDEGGKPVEVVGDDATVIEELGPVVCTHYRWFLTGVVPRDMVVTLNFVNCERVEVTVSDEVSKIGPYYDFDSIVDPIVSHGTCEKLI